jgi:hypothetical protein
MMPGVNRLRRWSLPLTRMGLARYTTWTLHPQIRILDPHLMSTSPRDNAVPRLRWDLVVRVRREIEAGTYETPEKWAVALARLEAELQQRTYNPDEQPAC